jgi:hypothetical protein
MTCPTSSPRVQATLAAFHTTFRGSTGLQASTDDGSSGFGFSSAGGSPIGGFLYALLLTCICRLVVAGACISLTARDAAVVFKIDVVIIVVLEDT